LNNLKKIIFSLAFIVLIFQIVSFTQTKKEKNLSQKPIVSVSTFAIYDITKHIAQDSVEIVNILPFGVSAHTFEPTPKLMAKIEKSKLVIFSGGGLEPWTDGFAFKNSVLNISKYVKLRELHKPNHHENETKDTHHHHGHTDPHYWLDIDNVKKATKIITQKLIDITPSKRKFYLENEQNYLTMLNNLQNDFDKSLKECKNDTLVSNHNAFSYMATKYHFKTAALSGLSPQSMPSAKDITKLMKKIKKDHIKTIFFESFANEKVIKTIAKDTNVDVDVLHPLGNITAQQASQHLTYEDIMRENLSKISKALECN